MQGAFSFPVETREGEVAVVDTSDDDEPSCVPVGIVETAELVDATP